MLWHGYEGGWPTNGPSALGPKGEGSSFETIPALGVPLLNTAVLLLSGDNDPVTPPAYAERVLAGGLANAKHVVGRHQGHGLVAVGCVPRLLRAFLEKLRPSWSEPR